MVTWCILAALTFGSETFEFECEGSFSSFRRCNQYLVLHAPTAEEGQTFRCVRRRVVRLS